MLFPNLRKEKKLWRKGFRYVVGVDEAGRGSWAGPIVAAAVVLDPKRPISKLADSKKLRAPQRQELFKEIEAKALCWQIGVCSSKHIDHYGLSDANIVAMLRSVESLPVIPSYILADGLIARDMPAPYENIIDGDAKVSSIAAASIVAKVIRDEIMDILDEHYPAYGFKQHKGYGTAHHHHMLATHGPCDIHRYSFEPIQNFMRKPY